MYLCPVLKQFLIHIHQNELCTASQKILLAVSGGLDSMVMLHLFVEAGYSVSVVHCNFQLRGEDSMKDELFIQSICTANTIPFFYKRFETDIYAAEHSLSIQMAARDLRYSWFTEILEKEGYDFIATAHHLNDSLETLLLNLTKGTSLLGLSGIPLKNGKIIRPLLFASHAMIKAYADLHHLKWREDLSNATDDYQRNFIRHQVVPKLKELNPSLEDTLQKSLSKIYGALELLNLGKAEFTKQIKKSEAGLHIPMQAIIRFKNPGAVLWEIIHTYGFNLEQCVSVITALNGQAGKKFISARYQLTINRGELIISDRFESWDSVTVEKGEESAFLGPFILSTEVVENAASRFNQDKDEAILDADKLQFPLVWRKWQAGDFFYPMGLNHTKKVSDFLIDNKISLPLKEFVTVLESDGQIIWVVGYRIDNRFKITDQTRSAISFIIKSHFG